MKNKEKLIKAFLSYQDKKNKLVKKEIGVDLIPNDVALTEEQVKDNIILLCQNFNQCRLLSWINCLHCNIWHDNNCDGCPYKKQENDCVNFADSSYKRATRKLNALSEVARHNFGVRLNNIGVTLENVIKMYLKKEMK